MSHELTITKGTCFALFAYDVGLDINLTDAERRFLAGCERGRLRHKTGAPQYVEYRPAPLRLVQEGSVFDVSQYSQYSQSMPTGVLISSIGLMKRRAVRSYLVYYPLDMRFHTISDRSPALVVKTAACRALPSQNRAGFDESIG